jgi:hypothetical protein
MVDQRFRMGCNEEFMGDSLCPTAFTIVQLTLFDASFSAFLIFFMNEHKCVLRSFRIAALPVQCAIFQSGAHFLAEIKNGASYLADSEWPTRRERFHPSASHLSHF